MGIFSFQLWPSLFREIVSPQHLNGHLKISVLLLINVRQWIKLSTSMFELGCIFSMCLRLGNWERISLFITWCLLSGHWVQGVKLGFLIMDWPCSIQTEKVEGKRKIKILCYALYSLVGELDLRSGSVWRKFWPSPLLSASTENQCGHSVLLWSGKKRIKQPLHPQETAFCML